MRHHLVGLLILLSVLPLATYGQYGSAVNQVTVNVNAISWMQVIGGAVNFNITDAVVTPGQNLMTLTNTSTQLQWGTNVAGRKITVQTNNGSQLFSLRLMATSPTAGAPQPEVTLSTAAADLLLNAGRALGTAGLQYTAVALATQGTGSDIHTITFTLTVQ
jgi:hypothetical protein